MQILARIVAGVSIGLCMLLVCRWIGRKDPTAGQIVGIGLAIRLWVGGVLFWISYLNMPLLAGLHTGGGFWALAPDARTYFQIAAVAAEDGLQSIGASSPSPAFIRILGLWMRVVGISPASGLLLNAMAYIGIAAVVVAIGSRDTSSTGRRAIRLPLLALSFCPGLLLFSTQALKDQVFCLILTGGCAAAWLFLPPLVSRTGRWISCRVLSGLLLMSIVLFLMAGIRPYVAFLMIPLAGLIPALFAFRGPRHRVLRDLFTALLLIALLWIPFKFGAGAYYSYYEGQAASLLGISSSDRTGPDAVWAARQSFTEAGGATSVISNRRPLDPNAKMVDRSLYHAETLIVGLALLFIPVSLLRWTSIVDFQGGRGLLLVTDLDTLFLDFTIAAVGIFMLRAWWPIRSNLAYFVFLLGLGFVLAALMAYVVTNFGTIFRLRLIVAMILWLLPLAAVLGARNPPVQRSTSSDSSPLLAS
jgi:hypothetical protein